MDLEREVTPKREATPGGSPLSSIPQKRAHEEAHTPSVPSPLNPEAKPPKPATATTATTDDAPTAPPRDKPARTKKEALKKRESRGGVDGGSSRATPDPKLGQAAATALDSNTCSPLRYKLAQPRPADFEQPKGPVFTPHHEIVGPDGKEIQFHETSDQ